MRPILIAATAAIRERGYAIEREELAFGRACVAAVIRDASGAVVATTSISGPLSALNLDGREDQLAARVPECIAAVGFDQKRAAVLASTLTSWLSGVSKNNQFPYMPRPRLPMVLPAFGGY